MDNGQQEFFANTEEEAHFYSVISDFCDLLEDYSPQFVMLEMLGMMQHKENSLNSLN
jgi:predicted nucleic acid-binding protein